MTRSEADTSTNLLAEPKAQRAYTCILAALAVVGVDIAYSVLVRPHTQTPFIGTPVGLEALWTRYLDPANARLTAQTFDVMLLIAFLLAASRRARSEASFPQRGLIQLTLPMPLVMVLAPVHAATGMVLGLVAIFAIDVSRYLAAGDRPPSTLRARAAAFVGASIAFGLALLVELMGRIPR